MKNPFKEIETEFKVPKRVRNRVLDDVAMIQLTLNFANFMLQKYPKIVTGFYSEEESS